MVHDELIEAFNRVRLYKRKCTGLLNKKDYHKLKFVRLTERPNFDLQQTIR